MSVTSEDLAGDGGASMSVPGNATGAVPPKESGIRAFWIALGAVLVASIVVVGYFGRRVFLFSDDYVFLYEAGRTPLDLDLLGAPIFTHFSPTFWLLQKAVVGQLPDHPGVIYGVLMGLAVALMLCVAILMVSLFGPSWSALVGTAVVAPTLSLLPLVNWWTAGTNMILAIAAVTMCLAGVVQLVRGRSRWWALVATGAYLVAVLSWEPGLLAPAFAALWVLLFRSRVTDASLRTVLRQTWWVWAALAVIGAVGVANYRLNYYVAAPAPDLGLVLQALYTWLFEVQIPMALGLFDPSRPNVRVAGAVIGALVVVGLLIATFLRSRRAWRGWVFAVAASLVPATAIVLNRVGYIGIRTVEQAMYFFLPTLLFVVGILEAWAAPELGRAAAAARGIAIRTRRGWLALSGGVVAAGAVAVAYLSSAWPTISSTNYGMIGSSMAPERDYVRNVLASAEQIEERDQPFSVLDEPVPGGLTLFPGHNRLSQVIGLHDPEIRFNSSTGPYYDATPNGVLEPARIEWMSEVTFDAAGARTSVQLEGVTGVIQDPQQGLCFVPTNSSSSLTWTLPAAIGGDRLVVESQASVDRVTPARVSTTADPGAESLPADMNPRVWTPDQEARLDTVTEDSISTVSIDSLAAGATTCMSSLAVGVASPAG